MMRRQLHAAFAPLAIHDAGTRSARRLGISAGVLVLGLILNVPLLWLLIGLAAWWLWSSLQRRR